VANTQQEAPERDFFLCLAAFLPATDQSMKDADAVETQECHAALFSQLNCFHQGAPWMDSQHTIDPITLSWVPAASHPRDASQKSYESDDDSGAGETVPDPADAPPATDAIAWFKSSSVWVCYLH
jgi:hypothetical protein